MPAGLNVDINSYGTLLISLILERIPSELKVIISRRFKDDVWDFLLSLIEIFKEELFARERIEAIDNTENSFEGENLFTAQTLTNHSYKNTLLTSLTEKNKFAFIVKVRTIFLQGVLM